MRNLTLVNDDENNDHDDHDDHNNDSYYYRIAMIISTTIRTRKAAS